MFYVYILQSIKDGRYYIGSTNNLFRRVKDHNSDKTLSLRTRIPLKIIYKEKYNNKLEAIKREKIIKSYKGGNAFKKLIMGP